MFTNRKKELDELFERVTQVMQQNCHESEKRMARLEKAHFDASERMKSIEIAAEANSSAIKLLAETHSTSIQQLHDSIKELNSAVTNVFQIVNLSQKNFEVIQHNFETVVTQIKGIQTENRHVLDHLFGVKE